ncbi:MAG TPA: hypothetical protein VMF69_24535 [Gemmataceae bacterium]|nr:hypothetical protein [Gemmataceae bacterium]
MMDPLQCYAVPIASGNIGSTELEVFFLQETTIGSEQVPLRVVDVQKDLDSSLEVSLVVDPFSDQTE